MGRGSGPPRPNFVNPSSPLPPAPQRYDDLFDPLQDPDVEVALRRIPVAEVEARNSRLRRALNLSMKKETLSEEMQKMQTPFAHYLIAELEKVRMENQEREVSARTAAPKGSIPSLPRRSGGRGARCQHDPVCTPGPRSLPPPPPPGPQLLNTEKPYRRSLP